MRNFKVTGICNVCNIFTEAVVKLGPYETFYPDCRTCSSQTAVYNIEEEKE